MEEDNKKKNAENVKNYRERQKALGRRARLLYLTDREFQEAKIAVLACRTKESLDSL